MKGMKEKSNSRNRRRWGSGSISVVRLINVCPDLLEWLTLVQHAHHVTRDVDADVSVEAHSIKYQIRGCR